MRTTHLARWASLALALSICVPAAFADNAQKSLADCTSFQQSEKADDALELAVHNSCSIPVDCKITWRVTCAPDAPKRRAVHAKSQAFRLAPGTGSTTQASAAVCGDDSFTLDHVQWSCEPNKD